MKRIKSKKTLKKLIFTCACAAIFLALSTKGFATITYTPNRPNVEQPVNFTVVNPLGVPPAVDWDFGDGTIVADDANVTHTYMSTGTFTVRALYGPGSPDTVQVTVTEKRTIVYSPKSPKAGKIVTFTAKNFLSNSVRWNFGDGTSVTDGLKQTHVYSAAGAYTVTAKDFGGSSRYPIQTTIQVEQLPPRITFNPNPPRVQEQVKFIARNFLSTTLIRWDFGDGTITNDRTPPDIIHIYTRAGYYEVKAYDEGGQAVTASVTVPVYPKARITFTPADPRPGEDVNFEAKYFLSDTLIRWDFGDGTIIDDTSPPFISHSYANPGAYQVRAYDDGQLRVTASQSINVLPERTITFSPPQPKAGEEITFQTHYFSSSSILWDFGDGTTLTTEGTTVKHTYQKEGIYLIKANDLRTRAAVAVSLSLTVVPRSGPRAPFAISYINLRFEDGKSYKVVPKGLLQFIAKADIKYEGTGNLLVQWIVDGIPFRADSKSLPFAYEDTIDSGKTPGLPTLVPGIHEVTLKFIDPQVDFDVPVIRYYVTPEASRKPPVLITISGAMDSQQQEITLSGNVLEAPAGGYVFLNGAITNEEEKTFPKSLLRIYLGSDVVDQQFISNLEPDQTQQFKTSIQYSTEEPGILYFILYDITEEPAALLSVKEVNIKPKE